jgi:hypothetical protein
MAIDIRSDGLSGDELNTLKTRTARVCELAALAATGTNGTIATWFGTAADQAIPRLACLNRYLNKRCWRITYVRKLLGTKCDNALVEIGDIGQVIKNVGAPRWNSTKRVDYTKHELNTPTGIRVFVLPEWFTVTANAMLNTIYHELSHKVIDTVDFGYGMTLATDIATHQPAASLWSALNYGFYAASLDQDPPDEP